MTLRHAPNLFSLFLFLILNDDQNYPFDINRNIRLTLPNHPFEESFFYMPVAYHVGRYRCLSPPESLNTVFHHTFRKLNRIYYFIAIPLGFPNKPFFMYIHDGKIILQHFYLNYFNCCPSSIFKHFSVPNVMTMIGYLVDARDMGVETGHHVSLRIFALKATLTKTAIIAVMSLCFEDVSSIDNCHYLLWCVSALMI